MEENVSLVEFPDGVTDGSKAKKDDPKPATENGAKAPPVASVANGTVTEEEKKPAACEVPKSSKKAKKDKPKKAAKKAKKKEKASAAAKAALPEPDPDDPMQQISEKNGVSKRTPDIQTLAHSEIECNPDTCILVCDFFCDKANTIKRAACDQQLKKVKNAAGHNFGDIRVEITKIEGKEVRMVDKTLEQPLFQCCFQCKNIVSKHPKDCCCAHKVRHSVHVAAA